LLPLTGRLKSSLGELILLYWVLFGIWVNFIFCIQCAELMHKLFLSTDKIYINNLLKAKYSSTLWGWFGFGQYTSVDICTWDLVCLRDLIITVVSLFITRTSFIDALTSLCRVLKIFNKKRES
jgi:hypothetical protein